jgi:peroxiredoxin
VVSVGDHVPEVESMTMTVDRPKCVQTGPGFVIRIDDLKAAGVDTIACVVVNDPQCAPNPRRSLMQERNRKTRLVCGGGEHTDLPVTRV